MAQDLFAAAVVCLAGLLALLLGAELVVNGGVKLARRLGVSPLVIGLTVVAIGTSIPELGTGIGAALLGNGALAVGNIAGTNTINLLLILGVSAAIAPLSVRLQTIRMDLPAMIVAALMMVAMASAGSISRLDGGILIFSGIIYTMLIVRAARQESAAATREVAGPVSPADPGAPQARREVARTVLGLAAGLGIIVFGADWFVEGAVTMTRIWGVSDAFIGLTIVAIGTSAPELVTTVIATMKNERDIALGNLLGSNVYNVFFVLGVTCLVPADGLPVPPELVAVDLPIMALASIVCAPVFISGRQVTRREGAAFVAAYALYLTYLVVARR